MLSLPPSRALTGHARALAALLVVGLLASATPPLYGQAGTEVADDSVRADAREQIRETRADLEQWLSVLNPEEELSKQKRLRLSAQVATLLDALDRVPSEFIPVAESLLDLASFKITRLPYSSFFVGGGTSFYLRRTGFTGLKRLQADGRHAELNDWLTRGVLAEPRLNSESRRWLALYYLLQFENNLLDNVLIRIARDPKDPLSSAALELLPTRSGPEVDAFLVALLDEPRVLGTPHPYNQIRERLQFGPLDAAAYSSLVQHVKGLLLSGDWRVASRGVELCRDMNPERATPMLIEALFTWTKRDEQQVANSRRIAWDIVAALQRLSGRNIGATPQNWMTWWNAVRAGLAGFADQQSTLTRTPGTTAEFFGLSPKSDRLTFIIDHSGSMSTPWARTKSTRYQQAIDQLMDYLQTSGQDTMFNIILFDSSPLTSTPHLIDATPKNLETARKSLESRPPSGSTFLRGAVEAALALDRYGNVEPAKVEIDTIVILCDGATDSGSKWVRPLLERINEDLRVVFHCVQIGPYGDGTLEELARLSGGDFIQIPE